MQKQDKKNLRLNAYISHSGICSRRKADDLIAGGLIKVNGEIIRDFGYRVESTDSVLFRNTPIAPITAHRYIAFNKPPQYICSHKSFRNQKTIYSLLPPIKGLNSCGRLDYLTSGLIILSNDGAFIHEISHPSHNIKKEYHVTALDYISDTRIRELRKENTIDGISYKPFSVKRLSKISIAIVLVEGKNREIRNLCRYFKIRLHSIHRVSVGTLSLASLESGAHRDLHPKERDALTYAHMH